jgi:hypothetical protein
LPDTLTWSVLNAVWVLSNVEVAVTRARAMSPPVCVPGTAATSTKRNVAPAASGPVVVSGVKLSGTPLPSASAYATTLEKSKSSPGRFATTSGKSSFPLPVLVRLCGNAAWPPGDAVRVPSAVSVKLATCDTTVVTRFDVAVRGVFEASR